MLKLELTDGTTTVNGMEYKPMKKLNTDILPGTKVGVLFALYITHHFCNLFNLNLFLLDPD
jgi:hypothetical protein